MSRRYRMTLVVEARETPPVGVVHGEFVWGEGWTATGPHFVAVKAVESVVLMAPPLARQGQGDG